MQKLTVVPGGKILKDGVWEDYVPKSIRTHREAYGASLDLLFNHVASFHLTMIEILAEKYDLDAGEMIETVREDPRFQSMVTGPTVEAMGYFGQADADKVAKKKAEAEVVEEVTKGLEAVHVSEAPGAPQPAKKKIIRKKPRVESMVTD